MHQAISCRIVTMLPGLLIYAAPRPSIRFATRKGNFVHHIFSTSHTGGLGTPAACVPNTHPAAKLTPPGIPHSRHTDAQPGRHAFPGNLPGTSLQKHSGILGFYGQPSKASWHICIPRAIIQAVGPLDVLQPHTSRSYDSDCSAKGLYLLSALPATAGMFLQPFSSYLLPDSFLQPCSGKGCRR